MAARTAEQAPADADWSLLPGLTWWRKYVPSGQTWTVAYADYDVGRMSWAGWPEGQAQITDCTLVEACTDLGHIHAVDRWLMRSKSIWHEMNEKDHRARAIRRLYRPLPKEWDPIALGC